MKQIQVIILIFTAISICSCTSNDQDRADSLMNKWSKTHKKDYDIDSITYIAMDSSYYSINQLKKIKELKKEIDRISPIVKQDSVNFELSKRYYKIHLEKNNIEPALLNRRSYITKTKYSESLRGQLQEVRSTYNYIRNNPRFQGYETEALIHYHRDYAIDTVKFYFDKEFSRIIASKENDEFNIY